MKIGDRVFVHGYVDEIRKDTVIIRNNGGYFGTIPSEIIKGDLVRCKDCVDWQESWMPNGVSVGCHYCATMDSYMKADDFCSYGEAREQE